MDIVTIQPEPRFLIRPGSNDHKLLDKLLSPGMLETAIRLDGLVIDAPHRKFFADLRPKLNRDAILLVDPQVYRFQTETWRDHPRLAKLGYSPEDGGAFTWDQFREPSFVTNFVRVVLDAQHELKPTHYMAPGFHIAAEESPWRAVNDELIRETLRQAGGRVYATLCGSYTALCRRDSSRRSIGHSIPLEVEGVFVAISPFSAYSETQTKLANYVALLDLLRQRHTSVFAARQPAFGLGCIAFGLSGFDAGIGATETFDYARLVHAVRQHSKGEAKGGRRKSFYVDRLLTQLPASIINDALPAFGGVVGCSRACCRLSQTNGVTLRHREHFVHTRLDEVSRIRSLPIEWRKEEFRERLLQARSLADRVLRDVPELKADKFQHLNTWDRCFTELTLSKARGATA